MVIKCRAIRSRKLQADRSCSMARAAATRSAACRETLPRGRSPLAETPPISREGQAGIGPLDSQGRHRPQGADDEGGVEFSAVRAGGVRRVAHLDSASASLLSLRFTPEITIDWTPALGWLADEGRR